MIRSITTWPNGAVTEESHSQVGGGILSCEGLIRQGLASQCEIYPLETRVEVDGETEWKWTKEQGLITTPVRKFLGQEF